MQFWCSATNRVWDWTPQAYPGVWLVMASLVLLYVRAWRRHRPDGELSARDRRRPWQFGLGVALLWIASDWPVGALGAGYLASVHMLQYMLYTLGAAPLILLGIAGWMLPVDIRKRRWFGAVRVLSRPAVAGITFNVLLIATHAPIAVDGLRSSQFGSFLLDGVWLISGLILWMPLISPITELRHPSLAVRCVYLFLACGVVPMIPGGILTFAEFPLYETYELSPPVGTISAATDQQVAGLIMKIGNIPIVWAVISVLFWRWAMDDRRGQRPVVVDAPTKA